MIESIEYKGYALYYVRDSEEILGLGKNIIDDEIEIFQEFKVTQRNYVAGVEYRDRKYILKSPRNEYRIPQRKIQTLFKRGEVLTTLININELLEKGFNEFSRPLLAGVKRKNGMICDSFLIMEFEEGRGIKIGDLGKIIEFGKKIHGIGRYHGDFNISNFLMTSKGLKVIDTQGKKYFFGTYRKHYEVLTFTKDLFILENHLDGIEMFNYPKDSFYYLAYFIKNFKQNSVIVKFRNIKKKLRDKGWKV